MAASLYLQVFVCAIIASTISASFYSSLFQRQFPIYNKKTCIEKHAEARRLGVTLYGGKQCSPSMQCAWQLCPRNSEQDCRLMCNRCSCPSGTYCQRDMMVRPGLHGAVRAKSEYRCL